MEGDALQTDGPAAGMIEDFSLLHLRIKPLLDSHLDHYYLNDSLDMESPTSEAVARWIFQRLKPDLPGLTAVIIDETCTSSCEYRPCHTK